jgi:hypothetical protein
MQANSPEQGLLVPVPAADLPLTSELLQYKAMRCDELTEVRLAKQSFLKASHLPYTAA